MNEHDEMGEQKYSRNRTDSLETSVLERTVLNTDLTAMEYEGVDWVHLFQDRAQGETLCKHKNEASTLLVTREKPSADEA
jgi:hypothetical protein